MNEIDKDDKQIIEFYELMQQFQQKIYDLNRGKLILPNNNGSFLEKDVVGRMLNEERPPRIFRH